MQRGLRHRLAIAVSVVVPALAVVLPTVLLPTVLLPTSPAAGAAAPVTGPAQVPLAVFAVPPCPESRDVTWIVVNPNGVAVDVTLSLDDPQRPWSRALNAPPGASPVRVTVGLEPPPVLTLTWDSVAARAQARSEPVAALAPGTAQHTSRCCGNPAELWLDKTAEPADGESLAPGDTVVWTVTVVSTGTAARTPAEVVDVVPDQVTVTDSGGATLSEDGRRLTWQLDLAPAERRDLRWTGRLSGSAPRGTDIVNTALVPRSGLVDATRHPVADAGPVPSTTTPPATTLTPTTVPTTTLPPTAVPATTLPVTTVPTTTLPTTTPAGATTPPAAGTTSTAPAATTPAATPPPPAAGGPPLSFTGAEVGALVAFGLAATALGVLLVWLVRRAGNRNTGGAS